jgi:hypothetical protein
MRMLVVEDERKTASFIRTALEADRVGNREIHRRHAPPAPGNTQPGRMNRPVQAAYSSPVTAS